MEGAMDIYLRELREEREELEAGITRALMTGQPSTRLNALHREKQLVDKKLLDLLLSQPRPATESDPTGRAAGEPGAKLDAGKPRMELLLDFGLALKEVAKVATFGASKYSDGGWQEVPDGVKRYTGAMMRHVTDERYGKTDDDSGLLHAAQVAWNALARLELMLRK